MPLEHRGARPASQGSGWVDSSESGRRPIEQGSIVFLPVDDTATMGTDDGMVVVEVFGGW